MARVGPMQKYKMQMRQLTKSRGRKKMMKQIPWYIGEDTVGVMDCVNPNGWKATQVVEKGIGKDFGLMFENAGKEIITAIVCPDCGGTAVLNMNWPAFMCTAKHDNDAKRIWEKRGGI